MAYQDFLREFAAAHSVGSTDELLSTFKDKYAFQIESRQRALSVVDEIKDALKIDFHGKKVLDVGCAYGSFSVEFAKLGCRVIGIDISDKWLKLAEANARDEADCVFINVDASSRKARSILKEHGPFDLVVVNDVFEHIYDTAGLLENLNALMKRDAYLYYKVPNGMAVRAAISEGHKKVLGISLLAPDYWHLYIKAPFHIYYRREAYFTALFKEFGYKKVVDLTHTQDSDVETTHKHIKSDLAKLGRLIKRDRFQDANQYVFLRRAYEYFAAEIEDDLKMMSQVDLARKYRATFWTGILQRT